MHTYIHMYIQTHTMLANFDVSDIDILINNLEQLLTLREN